MSIMAKYYVTAYWKKDVINIQNCFSNSLQRLIHIMKTLKNPEKSTDTADHAKKVWISMCITIYNAADCG